MAEGRGKRQRGDSSERFFRYLHIILGIMSRASQHPRAYTFPVSQHGGLDVKNLRKVMAGGGTTMLQKAVKLE